MNRILAGIGIVCSILYITFISYVFSWKDLSGLAPNNVGDFLAGVFGPITTLWLILGFFQQSIQLRQNNKALSLQAEELKNSVEQQKLQVFELKASAERQKELVEVTREQMTAEIAALQEERLRQSAIAKPRFVFKDKYVSHKQNTAYVTHIQNIGNTATDVFFNFTPNVKSCSHTNIAVWNRNDDQKIIITLHADDMVAKINNSYDQKYQLRISYIDALGMSGEQFFDLQIIDTSANNGSGYLSIQAEATINKI